MRQPTLILFLSILTAQSVFAQSLVENNEVYTGLAEITATARIVLKDGFRAVPGSNIHAYIDAGASYTPINYTPTAGGTVNSSIPTTNNNYVLTTVLREEETVESNINSRKRMETVAYFDGLGRPNQTINIAGSPNGYDIVQPMEYDDYGRVEYNYLPYVLTSSNDGEFVTSATTDAITTYTSGIYTGRTGDSSPRSKPIYEASPLNRILGEKGVGAEWQSKSTAINYSSNSVSIMHWNEDGNTITFLANELYLTLYTDEDGNQNREYKDKLDRVVRKEAYDGSNWLRTAYVYDDFGQLVTVIPPKASGPSDTELCYFYKYDKHRRMTMKDLPGANPVYMVYDKRDRLVMAQDGEMGTKNQWLATIYDAFNRPVITAFINNSATPDLVETAFSNVFYNAAYSSSGTYFNYNLTLPTGYTLSEANILTVTYYDDENYDFINEFKIGNEYDYTLPHLAGNSTTQSDKTMGLITGTLTRVLENGNDIISDNLLLTVNYYDDFGRIIRVIADNHLGGQDITYFNYDFTGQVTETIMRHNATGSSEAIKLATTFKYDHQGRMLSETLEMNDYGTETIIAANEYNELGEVIAKYLHGTSTGNNFNQKLDYTYNTKGWLRTLNQVNSLDEDLFAFDLRYNNPDPADNVIADARYNGNISEMRWNAGTPKGYGFDYDDLNRLRAADYAEGSTFSGNQDYYNTNYTYDKNGNIELLNRFKGSKIDGLDYNYDFNEISNQLLSLSDDGTSDGYHALGGNYLYDTNGNMTTDPSKGTIIDYNHLNLPKQFQFGANDNLRYTYDASGNKLTKVVDGTVAQNNTRLDYSGNFLYENDDLKAIFTSEGRIIPFDNNGNIIYKFEYNLKDHLGNTRVVFGGHSAGQPELMQITDYYPFGMVMNQQNYFADGVLTNNFLYNGKELQDDEMAGSKLDWYDYGARFYDPQLGRWHSVDPLAEWDFARSPYNYVANNPMRYIDPDGNFKTNFGAFLWKTFNGGGQTLQDKGSGEYFVSQQTENKGDADITVKRVFRGQKRHSKRSGRGYSQKGGIPFVKSGQSISPTNVRAKNPDRPVNIDDLMPAIGGVGAGRFQKSPLDIAQGIGKTSDAIQEMDGNKSDKEILEQHGGSQKQKTDAQGVAFGTGKYSTWKKTKSSVGRSYEDATGDSVLYINHKGDSTLYIDITKQEGPGFEWRTKSPLK